MTIPVYFWFPVVSSLGQGFMFMNIPPVAGQFMDLFGVSYGGLSFFLSAALWSHAGTQVPGGLLVDRIGAFRALIMCICIIAFFNLLPFAAPHSLGLAVFSRFMLGCGTGPLFLVTVKIAKLLTPVNYISRVQGALGAAFCFGTMLPYVTLPYLGEYGWIGAYLFGAAFCATLTASAFFLPREKLGKGESEANIGQILDAVKVISTSRGIWILGCCHGFAYGTLSTIGSWLPMIIVDMRPGSMAKDWAIAASIMLFVGTAGRMFGGEIPRFMQRGRLISKAVLMIGLLYLGLAFSNSPSPLIFCAFAMALVCGCTYASIFTLAIDISAPAYVATALGFLNMVANAVNVALTLLLGNTRDFTGSFAIGLAVAGGMALVFWVTARVFLLRMAAES